MNFWQRKAQNKASEDRRKGSRQGRAIVEFMRRIQNDREGKIQVPPIQEMAGLPESGDQTTGSEVRTPGNEAKPEDGPATPPGPRTL